MSKDKQGKNGPSAAFPSISKAINNLNTDFVLSKTQGWRSNLGAERKRKGAKIQN